MPGAVDITGQRFSRLTALHYTGERTKQGRVWLFSCDCGNKVPLPASKVRSGNTKSCGCLKSEGASARASARNRTHGMSGTPTWKSWRSMLDRCYLESHTWYVSYGGRGITVCSEWRSSFQAFYRDMGERPEGTTLDRIDNGGNYEPGNCRWATHSVQMRNRRDRTPIEAFGEALLAAEWGERYGIDGERIRARIEGGWEPERAITTPVRRR